MNNSIKPPIVVTEAEQNKFFRRFKKNMPKTFSGVIFHAADALEKFAERDGTKVRMANWHLVKHNSKKELVCTACLAGSAVIDLCGATGFEVEPIWTQEYGHGLFNRGNINDRMRHYENIVDQVRLGYFRRACIIFDREFLGSDALETDINSFRDLEEMEDDCERRSSRQLIRYLRRAAKKVKALGL